MNFKRTCFTIVATLILSCASALAWNCSDPLASRVDVGTTNPGGSAGNGDGQWFLGTGSEGISGHYYVCQKPSTPPPTTGGGSNTNTNTNSNSSNSTSGASSSSNSGATATGGNSTATGGNATGGSVNGSGNSSSSSGVSNSGNSSNTNNNTANGGQGGQGGKGGQGGTGIGVGIGGGATNNGNGNGNGNGSNNTTTANGGTSNANGNGSNNTTSQGQKQGQSQSSTSSANNSGGNSSNVYSNSETYNAAKIPVSTAYAPTTIPTSPCLKGYSGGGQGTSLGLSFGGSKVDENCAALETARAFDSMNERLAGCKVKISTKYAKKAGVTLEDCMATEMVAAPLPVAVVPPPAPQQPIVVVVPAQAAPAPVAVPVQVPAPSPAIVWTSVCTFAGKVSCNVPGSDAVVVDPAHPTSVCKIMIDSAARAYKKSSGARFILVGNRNRDESDLLPTARANNVRKLLEGAGVPSSAISVQVGSGTTRTVEIVLIQAQ